MGGWTDKLGRRPKIKDVPQVCRRTQSKLKSYRSWQNALFSASEQPMAFKVKPCRTTSKPKLYLYIYVKSLIKGSLSNYEEEFVRLQVEMKTTITLFVQLYTPTMRKSNLTPSELVVARALNVSHNRPLSSVPGPETFACLLKAVTMPSDSPYQDIFVLMHEPVQIVRVHAVLGVYVTNMTEVLQTLYFTRSPAAVLLAWPCKQRCVCWFAVAVYSPILGRVTPPDSAPTPRKPEKCISLPTRYNASAGIQVLRDKKQINVLCRNRLHHLDRSSRRASGGAFPPRQEQAKDTEDKRKAH